jgi:hypothetical protein
MMFFFVGIAKIRTEVAFGQGNSSYVRSFPTRRSFPSGIDWFMGN